MPRGGPGANQWRGGESITKAIRNRYIRDNWILGACSELKVFSAHDVYNFLWDQPTNTDQNRVGTRRKNVPSRNTVAQNLGRWANMGILRHKGEIRTYVRCDHVVHSPVYEYIPPAEREKRLKIEKELGL